MDSPAQLATESFPRVSVIIVNFNYEAYVGQAIESALQLDWPNVEVIVVDDGSTDGSRTVIERYASSTTILMQANSGQLTGANRALTIAHGEIIVFLDSDDLLHPALIREVMAVWTPSTSKVQVQMATIDARGQSLGSYLPQYHSVPTAKQIRTWAVTAASYPTPPGSGNVYARWFVDRLFPFQDSCGSMVDSYCIAAAPFLGDVHTVAKPLVFYRIHGRNQGALSTLEPRQFVRQLRRALHRRAYAQRIAATVGIDISERAVHRSLNFLCYRVASLRTAPRTHPIVHDSIFRVLRDVCIAFAAPQGVALRARIALVCWAFCVALLPRDAAERLVLWRFAPGVRPQRVRALLGKIGVVRV